LQRGCNAVLAARHNGIGWLTLWPTLAHGNVGQLWSGLTCGNNRELHLPLRGVGAITGATEAQPPSPRFPAITVFAPGSAVHYYGVFADL